MNAGRVFRLSPGEEAAVLKQRQGEKRKTRLLQVREQERGLARKLSKSVQARKENEKKALDQQVRTLLAQESQQELRELESLYNSRVQQMGKGHRDAYRINKDECKTTESKLQVETEQRERALARHEMAMRELSQNQRSEKTVRDQLLRSKKKALEVEKKRSRQVAARAYSSDQPLILNFEAQKGQRIQFDEADSYSSSYYHLPHTVVERDPVSSVSAHQAAKEWQESHEEFSKHSANARNEQDEKAWLRHKHALARVRLERDREDMMSQLRVLEKEDRAHRQRTLGGIPTNVFQPIHQRIEVVSEQQKDMEQTFERLLLRTNHEIEPLASNIASSPTDDGENELHGTERASESPKLPGSTRSVSSEPVQPKSLSPPTTEKDAQRTFHETHTPMVKSSKQIQTDPLSVRLPHMRADGLVRPTLSVTDTVSSATDLTTESSDYKRDFKASHRGASKPPIQPMQKLPNGSMQRLITMVKEQQASWKERQAKVRRIPHLSASTIEPGRSNGVVPAQLSVVSCEEEAANSLGVTEPSKYDKSEDTKREPSRTEEDASISMYPIVLQDSESDMYNQESYQASLTPSKMSFKLPATEDGRDHILSPPNFSVGNTGVSVEPLSITQYHTTLDSSSAHEHSCSPNMLSKNYPRNGFFGHHSPKSLSITPYNTTPDNSVSTQPPISNSSNTSDIDHHLVEKAMSASAGSQLLSLGDSERLSLDECGSETFLQGTPVGSSMMMNGKVHGNLSNVTMTGSDYSSPQHVGQTSLNLPQNVTCSNTYDETYQDKSRISFYGPPRIRQDFKSLYHHPNLPPLLAPSLDETSSTLADQIQMEETCENSVASHSDALPVQQPVNSSESFHLHYSSTSSSHPQPGTLRHPLQSFQSSTYSPVPKGSGELADNVAHTKAPVSEFVVDRVGRRSSSSSLSMQEDELEPTSFDSRSSQSPVASGGSSQGSSNSAAGKAQYHADSLGLDGATLPSVVVPVTSNQIYTDTPVDDQNVSIGSQSSSSNSFPEHDCNGEGGKSMCFQSPLLHSGQEQDSVPPAFQFMGSRQCHLDSNQASSGMKKSTQLERPQWSSMRDSVSMASYQTIGDQSRTTLSSDFSRLEFPDIALSYPAHIRTTSEETNFLHTHLINPLENPDISLQSSINQTPVNQEMASAQLSCKSDEDEFTDISQLSIELSHDEHVAKATGKSLTDENDVLEPGHENSQLRHGVRETPSSSLQAAFLRKKADFVEKSQTRMKNLRINALQRQQALQTRAPMKSQVSKPSGHSKVKICDEEKQKRTKGVKFSESPVVYSETSMVYPEFDLITREKDKMRKREMKERNLKLYNRLDEVKQKKEEENRIKRYAENRKKAKDYHQRLRTKSKILKQVKKDSSTAAVQARKPF